jgi:F-type H+-transporting ATPase subunit gamma
MARIREIRKRMVAVGNIQRITKTMQMIATAKFNAAVQRASATRPYADRIQQIAGEVAAAAGDANHPLLTPPDPPVGRELLLVITTDRGFCGAYNNNVLRTAHRAVVEVRERGGQAALEVAGRKGVAFCRFQRIAIEERHAIGDKPQYDAVRAIADRYVDLFTRRQFDAVRVAFMKFISSSRQRPELLTLLPLRPVKAAQEERGPRALYEFSPSSRELLADLLPRAVRTMLFQAFNDAVVSEQIMKMVAMKAATENARDLGKRLRRSYNRARQTQITTELMEVVGGAAALG